MPLHPPKQRRATHSDWPGVRDAEYRPLSLFCQTRSVYSARRGPCPGLRLGMSWGVAAPGSQQTARCCPCILIPKGEWPTTNCECLSRPKPPAPRKLSEAAFILSCRVTCRHHTSLPLHSHTAARSGQRHWSPSYCGASEQATLSPARVRATHFFVLNDPWPLGNVMWNKKIIMKSNSKEFPSFQRK